MKGFVIFALLIVGVFSGPLKEIRLNIKDEAGCGGENLRIKIRRYDGSFCETDRMTGFRRGNILIWKSREWNFWNDLREWWDGIFQDSTMSREENFGNCQGFEFDEYAEFSLAIDGQSRYCPGQIEFLAYENRHRIGQVYDRRDKGYGRIASFKRNMDNSCRNRRCSQRDNNSWFACSFDSWFNAIPNSEFVIANNQVTCPRREENACPVNELHAMRQTGRSRRQCFFNCPNIKRELRGRWTIVGETCHDVTFYVPQYEYCCQRPGTGFEQCPAEIYESDDVDRQHNQRQDCNGNHQNCNGNQQTEYGNDSRQPYPNQRRNCNGNHQNCNGNQQTEYGNDNRQPYPNQRRNCNGNQQNCNGNQQTEYGNDNRQPYPNQERNGNENVVEQPGRNH